MLNIIGYYLTLHLLSVNIFSHLVDLCKRNIHFYKTKNAAHRFL